MSEAGKQQIIRSRTKSFRDIYVAPVTQNDATAYAAGTGDWDAVVTAFVDGWASEKALAE